VNKTNRYCNPLNSDGWLYFKFTIKLSFTLPLLYSRRFTSLILLGSYWGAVYAENTATKIINMLKRYQPNVDSITVDNGLEFAYHESISKELKTRVYFARPNSPWQRGLNENTNGLIRQYLPKSRELIDITKEETRDIMLRLNNRPRKRLEFKTPYELFYNKNYKLTSSVALTS